MLPKLSQLDLLAANLLVADLFELTEPLVPEYVEVAGFPFARLAVPVRLPIRSLGTRVWIRCSRFLTRARMSETICTPLFLEVVPLVLLDVDDVLVMEGFRPLTGGRREAGVGRLDGSVVALDIPLVEGVVIRDGEASKRVGTARLAFGVIWKDVMVFSDVGSSSDSRRSPRGGVFSKSSWLARATSESGREAMDSCLALSWSLRMDASTLASGQRVLSFG